MREPQSVVDPPPLMLKRRRQLVASAISEVKAYDVPGFCRRLDLADGSEGEAFASKFKYAQKRLAEIDGLRVIEIAREILSENVDFALSEQLAKVDELAGPEVTTLTRRRLVGLFDQQPLSSELPDIELIRSVWPIATMPPHYPDAASLEEGIIRHTVANDDWSQRDLLEALGLLTCSRAQLFRFLEAVSAPDAQTPEKQRSLAEKIDQLLVHDGYRLAVAGKISGSPRYVVKRAATGAPSDESISATLAAFDPNQVHARWTMAMERRNRRAGWRDHTCAHATGGCLQVDIGGGRRELA
jgi:AbiJ N-terminal domain 3